MARSTLHKQCGDKFAFLNQVIDVFHSTKSIIEYSIISISRKVQINVYALYAYHYRCELLALVVTFIIKYMTFSLLFMLT